MKTKFHEEYVTNRAEWRRGLLGRSMEDLSDEELRDFVRTYEEYCRKPLWKRVLISFSPLKAVRTHYMGAGMGYELAQDILAERDGTNPPLTSEEIEEVERRTWL